MACFHLFLPQYRRIERGRRILRSPYRALGPDWAGEREHQKSR